jgi:predicted aspartyl protease
VRTPTSFQPGRDLIVVEAYISGPRGTAPVQLALDTAASVTTLVPDILDEIGYGPHHGRRITTVTSAVGQERGYMLCLAGIEALGIREIEFSIHVFDLAGRFGIDGLLGLNFLEKLNYEIRSAEGQILAERIERPGTGDTSR